MNPTLLGLFPVLIWGIAVPVFRLAQDQIGLWAAMGALYFGTGLFSAINQYLRLKQYPKPAVFRNPLFYARWFCFVLHEGLFLIGVSMVSKAHVPFVILINYLWPTSIIVCSVLIAGVKVTRWWAFITGSVIVVASLGLEIIGPDGFSTTLFANPKDCIAYGIIFIDAVAWGLYAALSRREGDAVGGNTVTPIFMATLALALPFSFLPGMGTWENFTPVNYAMLIGYCFMQFLAYQLWEYSVRHGSIVILSLMSDFIPWLSLITTNLLLSIAIGPKTVISVITLVAGAIITRYGTLAKKQPLPDIGPRFD